jgi:hypothetical protein
MKKAIAAVKQKLKPAYKIEDEAHYYAGGALVPPNRQLHGILLLFFVKIMSVFFL